MAKTHLHSADFERAADLISQADGLIVAAGAGMGVDSGLPDFRGQDGFWKAYPALGRDNVAFSSIANPEAFRQHPQRAWGFYGHRLALYRATVPHQGFQILKSWGKQIPHGSAVFTSNVDGHFQKAGFDETLINECHGSINLMQCLDGCTDDIWPADDFKPEVDAEQCLLIGPAPTCPWCGGIARPNIMMFGDWGWLAHHQSHQERRLDDWLSKVTRPVVVELGAGTAIPSVRFFSQRIIHERGGRLIRINPRESAVPSSKDVGLDLGAMDALTQIGTVLATS